MKSGYPGLSCQTWSCMHGSDAWRVARSPMWNPKTAFQSTPGQILLWITHLHVVFSLVTKQSFDQQIIILQVTMSLLLEGKWDVIGWRENVTFGLSMWCLVLDGPTLYKSLTRQVSWDVSYCYWHLNLIAKNNNRIARNWCHPWLQPLYHQALQPLLPKYIKHYLSLSNL